MIDPVYGPVLLEADAVALLVAAGQSEEAAKAAVAAHVAAGTADFPAGEPTMLLRGSDVCSPGAAWSYANACTEHDRSIEKNEAAMNLAGTMREWSEQHPTPASER